MELVSEWTRQTARAMAASLIAPLALLLASTLVAAGGGGLGGLGSLGEIASGPTVPDSGLGSVERRPLADSGLVNAGLGNRGHTTTASVTPGALTGTGGSGGSDAGVTPETPRTPDTPLGPRLEPLPPQGPAAQVPVSPPAQVPAPAPPAPPARDPIGDIVRGVVQGVMEVVPAPLKPPADGILDSLLGPPR